MKLKLSKRVVQTTLWSLATVGLLVSLGFANREQGNMKCKGIKVTIADNTGNDFIEPNDILEVLNSKAKKIKGEAMDDINTGLLEKIVYSNAFVEKAEVFSTIDGFVNIQVWQRNPVMRIINNDNEHFYVDDNGSFMPVSDKFTRQVVVASGYIFDDFAEKSLKYAVPFTGDSLEKPILIQLNEIALYLNSNEFWDAAIEQIYVNEHSEIELVPRVGNHIILLGNSENLEEKMNNLLIFYTQATSKAGWEKYDVINLKFKDQVICNRRQGAIAS